MDAGLYLCATPIGNLEDVTLRTLRVLRGCDAIYAEDTRHTLTLLNHYDIKKPLVSCHEHNEAQRAEEAASRVAAGEAIAYVSDAGMPGISDPGARLVSVMAEKGLPFTVLPGASASLTALVLSGMDARDACFAGFLPREKGERLSRITALSKHRGALIFYESPLRVAATAGELKSVLGERKASLVRELTKVHEECVRSTLGDLAARYAEAPPRGECVLVVAGADGDEAPAEAPEALIGRLMGAGMSAKDAAKQAAAVCGIGRSEAYTMATAMKHRKDDD